MIYLDFSRIAQFRLMGNAVRYAVAALGLTAVGAAYPGSAAVAAPAGAVNAIGVENEYADVIAQIGGKDVQVSAIETDPNTDPHTFEVSPKIAKQIAAAGLIVENGVGYDSWADKIMAAAPDPKRKVILPSPADRKTADAAFESVVADFAAADPYHAKLVQAVRIETAGLRWEK